jgi:hypothetical protein
MEVADMKSFSSVLLFGSGVLVFSLAANAQTRSQGPYYPQRDDPYYRNDPNRGYYPDQSRYGYDRYGYGRSENPLIGRVLADLNTAASNARLDGHERKHFDEATRQLVQFEDRWAQGKFDSGKLNEAIEDLEHASFAPLAAGTQTTATGITATVVTIRTSATIRIGASFLTHLPTGRWNRP